MNLQEHLHTEHADTPFFNGPHTRSTTPGLLQQQQTRGGVTHPTTLSRPHGAPTMCPHRAIISRAGGWAFEHGEPSSHKLHTALRCMLRVCEVFGACTVRAGIPTLTHRACRHSFFQWTAHTIHHPRPAAAAADHGGESHTRLQGERSIAVEATQIANNYPTEGCRLSCWTRGQTEAQRCLRDALVQEKLLEAHRGSRHLPSSCEPQLSRNRRA